jgi:copper chaperone CopZ
MAQEFTVLDMTCAGCAASVRKAVARVPGVKAVDTDVARNRVRVAVAEDVSSEAIVAAINNAGYYEVAPVTKEPTPTERWRANAVEVLPSSTESSSGCSCCG